jgi:hypothetical protein
MSKQPHKAVPSFISGNNPGSGEFTSWYTTSKSPANAPIHPNLDLDVPQFGVVFMNPPEDARVIAESTGTALRYTQFLTGALIITLPPEAGPKKFESIYIGFKACSKLVLDLKEPVVEDELYSYRQEIQGGLIDREAR